LHAGAALHNLQQASKSKNDYRFDYEGLKLSRAVEVVMEPTHKIPGDKLVLGMLSAFRTLVLTLSKNGVIDLDEYVTALQQTAAEHRQAGDPNKLANAIHAISIHILSSAAGRG
jgi:hypothetical protein